MFHRILAPTDGSPVANLALPPAADLARRSGAALTLLYVVPPPLIGVFAEGAASVSDHEDTRERLLEDGARVVCREANGQPVAAVIADEVERGGADLVVMGTHGRSGLTHFFLFFLGSVAEAVLRQVRVPLLLIRAPAQGVREDRTKRRPARP